jgi:pyruvate,water dikinase
MSLRPLVRRTRQFRWYREAVSSLYTYGYGLFRPYFLALGQRLVSRGLLDSAEDVFYLTVEEARSAVHDGAAALNSQAIAQERRAEMASAQDVLPPDIVYGDEEIPIETNATGTVRGVPTSRGHYTGPARIIRGLDEFEKLAEGDVLVIPYSDVGWTPLFAKAAAVVAEAGGMLSHSSIVAREYGIPAVVSVPGALNIQDGAMVTVDGYRGEIIVR